MVNVKSVLEKLKQDQIVDVLMPCGVTVSLIPNISVDSKTIAGVTLVLPEGTADDNKLYISGLNFKFLAELTAQLNEQF